MTLRCREQAEVRPPHPILGLLIGALPFTPNSRFGATSPVPHRVTVSVKLVGEQVP
jgi:hypothetical protein